MSQWVNSQVGIKCVIAFLVVVYGLTAHGCFRKVSKDELITSTDSADYEEGEFPVIAEGGTLSLMVQGQPVSVKAEQILYNNTEGDYPDYVEITGPGLYIEAVNEAKLTEGDEEDWHRPHASLIGKPLPIQAFAEENLTIELPGFGEFVVVGGSVTLRNHEGGMDGVVKWEGDIDILCQTASGPQSAKGTFSFGMVPVW